jgi:hypothetical protein
LRSTPGVTLLAVCLGTAFPGVARAVVLGPGGSPPTYTDPLDYRRNTDTSETVGDGEVLASRTTPFEIRIPSEEAGHDLWYRGTLRNEVVRERGSPFLSFHYFMDYGDSSGDTVDFDGAGASGFAGFATDVRATWWTGNPPTLRRSDDGDVIYYRNGDSLAFHHLVVRTDATAFAEGGAFSSGVEFEAYNESGTATIATFRPVPEPAAIGLLVVTGAAALPRRRRRPAGAPRHAAGR